MAKLAWGAMFALALLVLADAAAAQGVRSYYTAIKNNPDHKLMIQMVDSNPTYKSLMQTTTLGLTVFAPTDAAFNAAAKKYGITPEAAMKNRALLQAMIMYHVTTGSNMRSSLKYGQQLPTLYKGLKLKVTTGTDTRTGQRAAWVTSLGSKARIVKADQVVLNPKTGAAMGVVHDINAVLLPAADPKTLLSIK